MARMEKNSYAPLKQDLRDAEEVESLEPADEVPIIPTAGGPSSSGSNYTKRRWLLQLLSHLLCLLCGGLFGMLLQREILLSSKESTPTTSSSHSTGSPPSLTTTKVVDGVVWEGTQCGSSWEEARAMGCHFDVMASRWYSPECFDSEALQEMLQEPQINYTWFADQGHTVSLHPDTVMAGEFDKIYPLHDFHIGHCLYLWRRLHRAVLHNRPLDDELFSYEHTVHCTRLILRWKEPWATVTYQTSGRPFCRRDRLGYISSL